MSLYEKASPRPWSSVEQDRDSWLLTADGLNPFDAGDCTEHRDNARFAKYAVNNIEAQEAELSKARMELITAGCEWQELAEQKQAVEVEVAKLLSLMRANLNTMEETAKRCRRWGKATSELQTAIDETRAALSPVLIEDGEVGK